jgi:hypothetical protein
MRRDPVARAGETVQRRHAECFQATGFAFLLQVQGCNPEIWFRVSIQRQRSCCVPREGVIFVFLYAREMRGKESADVGADSRAHGFVDFEKRGYF